MECPACRASAALRSRTTSVSQNATVADERWACPRGHRFTVELDAQGFLDGWYLGWGASDDSLEVEVVEVPLGVPSAPWPWDPVRRLLGWPGDLGRREDAADAASAADDPPDKLGF